MFRSVKVLGGVRVLRGVATTDVATSQAETQVHPGIADFKAILATLLTRMPDLDLTGMCAALCQVHRVPLS